MKRNLKFERYLQHSPERVWKALTDSRALSGWYLNNDFSPIVGHRFTFTPAPEMGFQGNLCGEVIRVDAPHQLVYTFRGGSMQGETVVTWTLIPDGSGTRLLLQHTGFNDMAGTALETMMTICPSRFLNRLAESLDNVLLVEV